MRDKNLNFHRLERDERRRTAGSNLGKKKIIRDIRSHRKWTKLVGEIQGEP